MSFRTILVQLGKKDASKDLLSISIALAQQHNAHLIGMYVTPTPHFYVSSEFPASAGLIERCDSYHRQLKEELRKDFEHATANSDFVSEWREVDSIATSVAQAVTDVARTVDLVVMSQRGDDSLSHSTAMFPVDVVLSCARPVIVVPSNKALPKSLSNIFVAWDGREQAVRALFDSLPLLREADNVRVHSINVKGGGDCRILTTPGELANTLSRHGVNVTLSESEAVAGDVGNEILQYANDTGSDLLVMGAYGHARIREYVFGGVTRKILYEMPIPVLMSH